MPFINRGRYAHIGGLQNEKPYGLQHVYAVSFILLNFIKLNRNATILWSLLLDLGAAFVRERLNVFV